MDNIVEIEDMTCKVEALKAGGKTVSLVCRAFEVFGLSHLKLLRIASDAADYLLVAVLDDAQVERSSRPGRPVATVADRMRVVAAIEGVDWVFSTSGRNLSETIENIRPDVMVYGPDNDAESISEREIIESIGSKLLIAPVPNFRSTSDFIGEIVSRRRA